MIQQFQVNCLKLPIKMSEGEMMEIQMGKNPDINIRDYIQVLENKTDFIV